MFLWLSVFSKTLCPFLLYTHIYSGTLQQGSTNWTPDEIGSASYTSRLDKRKPAWPLNKHPQLLFGLWAPSWTPSWTPSMEGKHKADKLPQVGLTTHASHSVAQLRRRMPWQVKPLTCVWVRGSLVESVFTHKHALEPNGQPLFLFPLARMSTQRNGHTHSHVSNLDERCRCQKNKKTTVLKNTHTVSSLKFSGFCTSSVE